MPTRTPEEVIAESTAHCRESGRLTWVVLDWLIHHVEQIDEQRLLQETRETGDLAVLGVLCDAARFRPLLSNRIRRYQRPMRFGEHLGTSTVRVYYARVGDWGNVRYVERS